MAKASPYPHEDVLALYEALVATNSDIDRKGAKMPYTSLNGHMFSFLDGDGNMSLRLPAEDLDAFIADHDTRQSEQHGRIMKEYAIVPGALLADTAKLKSYFDMSVAYVGSLKPKPTKKKKTK